MQTGEKEAFKRPTAKKKGPIGSNQGKYCRYHRSTGHDIHDFRNMKEEVESQIHRGHPQEFIVKPGEADQPRPQQPSQQGLGQRA